MNRELATLLIISVTVVGIVDATNYMSEKASVKGVGYKNVKPIIQTKVDLSEDEQIETKSESTNETLAAGQIVPVGQENLYNVSLDLAGGNITVVPKELQVTEDYIMHWTLLVDPEDDGWSSIYVYEFILPQPLDNVKRALVWGLETTCINVTFESCLIDGMEGYLGSGFERDGGWRCWSVAAPLVHDNENLTAALIVSAKFENETLNEHIVKTVNVME